MEQTRSRQWQLQILPGGLVRRSSGHGCRHCSPAAGVVGCCFVLLASSWHAAGAGATDRRILIEDRFEPVLPAGWEDRFDPLWAEHVNRTFNRRPRLDLWRVAGNPALADDGCLVKGGKLHLFLNGENRFRGQGIRSRLPFDLFAAPLRAAWRLDSFAPTFSRVILCLSGRRHANGDLHADHRYLAVMLNCRPGETGNLVTVNSKLTDVPGETELLGGAHVPGKASLRFRLDVDKRSFRLFVNGSGTPAVEGQHRLEAGDFPEGAFLYLQARQCGSARVAAVLDDVTVSQRLTAAEGEFLPVDIGSRATMALRDDVAGDRTGGWTDQGSNDMRTFPVGRQVLDGVPFHIASNEARDNRSAIVLGSQQNLPFLPDRIEGVRVALTNVSRVHFLHTAAYFDGKGEIGRYVIRLEKHTPTERQRRAEEIALGRMEPEELEFVCRVPLGPTNVRDWWEARAAPAGALAWAGPNGGGKTVGVHHFVWDNPTPERRLLSVEVVRNASSPAIPILLAITAERCSSAALGRAAQRARVLSLQSEIAGLLKRASALADGRDLTIQILEQAAQSLWSIPARVPEAGRAAAAAIRQSRGEWAASLNSLVVSLDAISEEARMPPPEGGVRRDVPALRARVRTLSTEVLEGRLEAGVGLKPVLRALFEAVEQASSRLRALEPSTQSYFGRAALFYLDSARIYADDVGRHLATEPLSPWRAYLAGLSARNSARFLVKAASHAGQLGAGEPRKPLPSRKIGYRESFRCRSRTCLNGVWEFRPGGPLDHAPEDGWFDMPVPHVGWPPFGLIAIPGAPYQDLFSFADIDRRFDPDVHHAWYRLDLDLPADCGHRVLKVRFESVAAYAEVYVNGLYCGSHRGTFAPFEIDITPAASPGGANIMAVLVQDPFRFATGEPYEGRRSPPCLVTYSTTTDGAEGGILGDVSLVTHPIVYVDDVFVRTSVQDRVIRVDTTVVNQDERSHAMVVVNKVVDDGVEVLELPSSPVVLRPGECRTLSSSRAWPQPKLWGIGGDYGDPHLYDLATEVLDGGESVDCLFTRFGFREFRVDGTQFTLNGRPIPLQGESLTMVGGAYRQHENRYYFHLFYDLLRQANVNLVRCFEPQCPAAYRVADEVGMLVTDQFPLNHGWCPSMPDNNMLDPAWNHFVRQEVREWVRAHRNHPSIVLWSVENENLSRPVEWKGRRIEKLLGFAEAIRTEDPTRTTVHHGNQGFARDPRFSVAVLHYVPRNSLTDWRKRHAKPVVLGEFFAFGPHRHVARHSDRHGALPPEDAVAEMARTYADDIGFFRGLGVAGIMPFQLNWALFDTSAQAHMGPWADKWPWPFRWEQYPSHWYSMWVEAAWPAYSGEGLRVRRYRAGSRTAVNWFDHARPAYVTNAIYEAVRGSFGPMPALRRRRAPEAIVCVRRDGAPVAHGTVILTPAEGQLANPVGVRADSEGRAWFRLDQPGAYRAHVAGGRSAVQLRVDRWRGAPSPGYANVSTVALDVP